MNNDIPMTTSVRLVRYGCHEQDRLTSDLIPTPIHFGTLTVQPIKVCVITSDQAEIPEDFEAADRVFDHVRARLIQFSLEIESEIGPGWKVMITDGDSTT